MAKVSVFVKNGRIEGGGASFSTEWGYLEENRNLRIFCDKSRATSYFTLSQPFQLVLHMVLVDVDNLRARNLIEIERNPPMIGC